MIRIVRLSFHPQFVQKFKSFFEERQLQIRNFVGCTYLELWQDQDEEGVFYTYSIWQQQNDLETYRSSALFEETWTQVKQWFNQPPKAFSAQKIKVIP